LVGVNISIWAGSFWSKAQTCSLLLFFVQIHFRQKAENEQRKAAENC